jgi:hypothetical protein
MKNVTLHMEEGDKIIFDKSVVSANKISFGKG